MEPIKLVNCSECGKEISDQEWVVNWGSCANCLDAHYAKYLESHPEPVEINLDFVN